MPHLGSGVAPVRSFLRLLLPAWARAFVLTNLGGLAVVVLVVATESADDPLSVLWMRLSQDVPHTWALLSPALALAAAALAVTRLRGSGELLALASLGVSRGRVLGSVLWVAAPAGVVAALVGRATDPAVSVARAAGAWVVNGAVLPDPGVAVPSASVLAAVRFGNPWDWPGTAALLLAGSVAGAALGVRGGSRSVLVAAAVWLVGDLVRRGSEPLPGLGVLATAAGLAAGLGWWGARGR